MTLYLDSIITFGKHSGKRVSDLPQDYVTWLKENTKHKIKSCMTPEPEEVKPDKSHLPFLDSVRLEDNFRRMCTEIGRKLIYDNVQIPF